MPVYFCHASDTGEASMSIEPGAIPTDEVEMAKGQSSEWSLPARVGFRFAFCYLLLFCMPSAGQVWLLDTIPDASRLAQPWVWIWHRITPWVAIHVFHLQGQRVTYFPTGSGDTTLDYMQYLLFFILAAVAALIWSLLDRKRPAYNSLYAWLRVVVRLTLAVTLLSYGMAKVVPTQFQPPRLPQLTETYGESSPMGLLWTFMGASIPYVIFSGLAELSAAVLLIFRRTALLGALLATAVMLNVSMLNFCYDVPVKLYSTHLLLLSLFLLLPDLRRLADLFVLNKTAPPADLTQPWFPKRWMRTGATAMKILLFLYAAGSNGWEGWRYLNESRSAGVPPVYGVYDVDTFTSNNPGKPALEWKRVIAERGYWAIRQPGETVYFESHFNPKASNLELISQRRNLHGNLVYSWTDADHLLLTGKLGNDAITVHLHRFETSKFLLTSRGFHWINEYPFNR